MLNRSFARYLSAAAAVAAALTLHRALSGALHAELTPYITFYPAIMLPAVLGGFGPGLAATALSVLVVDYFILPPVGQFSIDKPADLVGIVIFCLMGIFMSVVAERYRRNRERAAAAEKELILEQARTALAESQQRWATTLRSIGDAVIAVDASANITFMNEPAQSLAGWSEAEARGKPADEIFRLAHEHTGEPIESPIARAMRLNQVVEVANQAVVVARGGSRIPVEDSAAPIHDESGKLTGVVLVFRDVTERRARRREREQMLQVVQRQAELQRLSFDAIIVWRLEGGIESWNLGAEQLYGYAESEALGRVTHELIKSVHPKPWSGIEPELRANGFWEGEIRHHTKDGREVIVWARKRFLRGDDGIERVLEANRDITGRKRAEEQLQRLNRTLQALSKSNQALMHATDEQAFLQQVCRIITEDCGYAMVWIGFAENDENKTVRSVASAGFEEGYLEATRITWADSEFGRGPTGTAIRTGQPSICRNMLTDPAFLPWREQAVKRGYASSLVVPLKEGDKVFGAITIYSSQPDAFSEGEVSLLTELAGDLTYGINTLRVRAARAQAEEALRQSEQQFRELAEGIQQLAWTANPDGWIYWYNQRWYQYTGTSPQQMEGWGWQSVHDPNELPRVMEQWKSSIATGEPFDMVFPLRGADGVFRPFLTRVMPLRDAQGRLVRWFGTNTDISEQRKMEEALRQSEQRWATTLRSIGDAVISTCAQGKVMFMNDVAQALTGWTLAEAQGKDMETVFHIINEVTREKPENPVAKVLRLGQIIGLANHTALIGRDGTEYPIEDSAAPIRNQDGTTTGVVLVFHDVTEKRKAEQALRQSDRLATTGRLAATLAHEIHNPLDTVGNLLFLIDQVSDLQTARQYAAMASDEVARVTQMTRHMLSFQRESSKPVPVDIAEVLDSAIALFDRKIASSKLQIEKQVNFDHEFLGLTSEIRQVLVNLFSNAVEAVGQNGKIRLRAHASHNWHNGQRGLRVTVADNGPGIPAAIRGRIFEPFFTTKGEAGTGLGLWIASGIIEKCGGTLRLRSVTRAGRSGTSFSVFLPIED